jgi:CHAT domain-containing protein
VSTLFSVLESLRLISTSSSEVSGARSRHPDLEELHGRLGFVRGELNDLGLTPPDEAAALEAWCKEVLELSEERDRLEQKLRTALAKRNVFTETPTSDLVAAALDPDSISISYLRYAREHTEGSQIVEEQRPWIDSLLAFVVAPEGKVWRVELGPSAELEELTLRWREALGRPVGNGFGAVEESEERVGRRLRAKLLDPCLAVLGNEPPKRLHVVLDDFLHLVPIDSLPWADGRRLGEVVTVHQEVSMQRLVAPQRPSPEQGTLVALGGIDFDALGIMAPSLTGIVSAPPVEGMRNSAGESTRFEPLLKTGIEVKVLGQRYSEFVGQKPTVLLGEEASKKALVELAGTARYLHIATHGWFASEAFKSMRESAENPGNYELTHRLSLAEKTLRGFAPETLCGLALAGANHGANSLARVPGILTAEELATLDLSSCELAVLSACETNVGLRRAGQGIQSLQGALHAAGVHTAITSLWKVPDEQTKDLMTAFYTNLWEHGMGKAEALWEAKRLLRARRYPVSAWAGWVLTGDPR